MADCIVLQYQCFVVIVLAGGLRVHERKLVGWRFLVQGLLSHGKKNLHEHLRGRMGMIDFQLVQLIDNNPTIGALASTEGLAGRGVDNVAVGG